MYVTQRVLETEGAAGMGGGGGSGILTQFCSECEKQAVNSIWKGVKQRTADTETEWSG